MLLLADCGRQPEQARPSQPNELQTLRAELEEIKTQHGYLEAEVARLREDNEDLLRLRNEVRQLRDEKTKLLHLAQSAQTEVQAQAAQAQALVAQNIAQTLSTNTLPEVQLSPDQQAFAARYGKNPLKLDHFSFCIINVRQIDQAKQQWALEHQKTAPAVPTAQDLVPYLTDGLLPLCPGGGQYTLNAIGVFPTCSIADHGKP